MNTQHPLEGCEHPNIDNPVYISRAKWLCPDCHEDISLLYVLFREAERYETEDSRAIYDD
jgi:hypothetical protein